MRPTILRLLPLAITVLVGCSGTGGPLDGVWLLESTEPEQECTTTLTSNLRNSDLPEPGEPGDWTDLDDREQSLDLFFVRIVHGRADDTVMLVNDQIIPGVKLDSVTWEFSYVAEVTDIEGREHTSGYHTSWTTTSTVTNTYTVERVGNQYIKGDAVFDTKVVDLWSESDNWDDVELGFSFGDLPAYYVGATDNLADVDDCTDDRCNVERKVLCANRAKFVGTYTGIEGDGTFDVEDNSSSSGF